MSTPIKTPVKLRVIVGRLGLMANSLTTLLEKEWIKTYDALYLVFLKQRPNTDIDFYAMDEVYGIMEDYLKERVKYLGSNRVIFIDSDPIPFPFIFEKGALYHLLGIIVGLAHRLIIEFSMYKAAHIELDVVFEVTGVKAWEHAVVIGTTRLGGKKFENGLTMNFRYLKINQATPGTKLRETLEVYEKSLKEGGWKQVVQQFYEFFRGRWDDKLVERIASLLQKVEYEEIVRRTPFNPSIIRDSLVSEIRSYELIDVCEPDMISFLSREASFNFFNEVYKVLSSKTVSEDSSSLSEIYNEKYNQYNTGGVLTQLLQKIGLSKEFSNELKEFILGWGDGFNLGEKILDAMLPHFLFLLKIEPCQNTRLYNFAQSVKKSIAVALALIHHTSREHNEPLIPFATSIPEEVFSRLNLDRQDYLKCFSLFHLQNKISINLGEVSMELSTSFSEESIFSLNIQLHDLFQEVCPDVKERTDLFLEAIKVIEEVYRSRRGG